MTSGISIAPVYNSTVQSNSSAGSTNLSNNDFTRILLAQMASPNLSSLFNSETSGQGTTGASYNPLSSLTGGSNPLSSFFQNSSSSAFSPSVNLAFYSNLIGKKVSFIDQASGETVSSTVKSVILDNSLPMLNTDAGSIDPALVKEVM